MRAIRWVLLTTILVMTVGACGCPVTKVREAAARQQRMNSAKVIGLAYLSYCDDIKNKNKAPQQSADLQPYIGGDPGASALLSDGSFVFIYGVTQQDLNKKGMSQTVLGYDRAVETDKGIVLMADGATQYVTADEFKKMTKAAPAQK